MKAASALPDPGSAEYYMEALKIFIPILEAPGNAVGWSGGVGGGGAQRPQLHAE